jgi:YhcH/YjgK/YiaL family protein
MIHGNNKYFFYKNLNRQIQKCISYVIDERLIDKAPGSYELCGEYLFVNIVEYETIPEELGTWESHKEYIDLHYILKGKERINIGFVDNMNQKTYDVDKDSMFLIGEKNVSMVIAPSEFAVFCPEDAHMTKIQVDKSEKVKKAIFKIKVEQ